MIRFNITFRSIHLPFILTLLFIGIDKSTICSLTNLQYSPIRAFHEHVAIFCKLLGSHYQGPDLSLDLLLQIGPQRLDFIHVHVVDDEDVD